jgi:hypothetical protein
MYSAAPPSVMRTCLTTTWRWAPLCLSYGLSSCRHDYRVAEAERRTVLRRARHSEPHL